MIKFDIEYHYKNYAWYMPVSCGDAGYAIGVLVCKPTQKQVRKFKQEAHKAIKSCSHEG